MEDYLKDIRLEAEFDELKRSIRTKLMEELHPDIAVEYTQKVKKISNAVVAEGELSYEEGISLLNELFDEISTRIEEEKNGYAM